LNTYVIDTNIILHDPYCLKNYQGHRVCLPISVLEELDKFKSGHEPKNYNAREFQRILEDYTGKETMIDGVSVDIWIDSEVNPMIEKIFPDKNPDHRILNVAHSLGAILVTKDSNLRIRARAIGVTAEDYTKGKVEPPQNAEPIKVTPSKLSKFFEEGIPYDGLYENQYVILKAGKSSGLGIYRNGLLHPLYKEKFSACRITAKNAEQVFALHALLDPTLPLVVLSGTSGSGKTLLALAAAIQRRSEFRQIFVARPIIPLSNREMGFLPGTIKEKMDPYMQPIFDNLHVIRDQYKDEGKSKKEDKMATVLAELKEKEKLVISPLAYIRGRSLNSVYFILDEAQNTSPLEIKTVGSRMGVNAKLVVTGDVNQIDLPYLDSRSNGLSYLVEKMKGERLFAHVDLVKGERSELSELVSTKL